MPGLLELVLPAIEEYSMKLKKEEVTIKVDCVGLHFRKASEDGQSWTTYGYGDELYDWEFSNSKKQLVIQHAHDGDIVFKGTDCESIVRELEDYAPWLDYTS